MSARHVVAALHEDVKWQRADGRCECIGECGLSHKFGIYRRCPHRHGYAPAAGRNETVSLTVIHLDGDEYNNTDTNLAAMCQMCARRHQLKVKRRRAAQLEAELQHDPMFDVDLFSNATP